MATAFVNKHITRVLAAGGTIADAAWLDTVDAWITSQSLYGNLVDWSNPAFGVVKNGSNEISRIVGLGTTWLPRLGDLTPSSPTDTTYSATAINGFPGWVNAANTAYSYYGGNARAGSIRTNNIRRLHFQGITIVGVYTKSGTAVASLLGYGQFGGFYLQNTSGSPGSCKFSMRPVGGSGTEFSDTNSTTLTNAAVHIIGGTFDTSTVKAYVEGVAGSGSGGYTATNTGNLQYRPLLGGATITESPYTSLYSGSSTSHNTLASSSTIPTLDGVSNEALFSSSDLIIFSTALTSTQMASLKTLLRNRYGP